MSKSKLSQGLNCLFTLLNISWRIPWREEPGRLQSLRPWGLKEWDTTERLPFTSLQTFPRNLLRASEVEIP